MPRKSPYVIALSNREQAELEARSRDYTLPYREVVRAKIVLLASAGAWQRPYRSPPRHAAPDRQQVASAVLYASASWP